MMERPAEDLGVVLPEPKSSKKKKMTKNNNGVGDGMTKSMRRFLEARAMSAAKDAEVTRKAAEIGGDRGGTKLEDAVAASTMRFAAARREQVAKNQRHQQQQQQQRRHHQDDGDALPKATTKRSNDRRTGDGSTAALASSGLQVSNVVQSHRTNRQVKRRAFEKKKRQKKRDKRLGVTRLDDDVDYDDDEEDDVDGQPFMRGRRNRGDFVSANEDDDNLPAFRRVNEAPPSFALGVRGKPFTRNLSR